jgi:uncharacterized protein
VQIEFDSAKEAKNIRERVLSLYLGARILTSLPIETEDIRYHFSERRMIAFGMIAGRVLCVAYTWQGKALRILSVRKANAMEIRKWLTNDRR